MLSKSTLQSCDEILRLRLAPYGALKSCANLGYQRLHFQLPSTPLAEGKIEEIDHSCERVIPRERAGTEHNTRR